MTPVRHSSTLWTPLGAAIALGAVMFAATGVQARPARGPKQLAMKQFDVSAREVTVVATAKADGRGGAALVRLQNVDVPTCHLLVFDVPPNAATQVAASARLPVCAAYDKDVRSGKLERVALTSSRSAWRVSVLSRRVDAMAKGVETRRLWALYADVGAGLTPIFERTSTSFDSKADKAINQAEVCDAPVFAVDDEPTSLTVQCDVDSMVGRYMRRKRSTFNYLWQGGRFVAQ